MPTIDALREYRLGQYAIFDFVLAFGVMILLAPLLSKLFRKLGWEVPKRNWVILTLPISVLAHLLVGSMTPMTLNFLDIQGHYLLKLVILGSLVFGFRGIKKSAD